MHALACTLHNSCRFSIATLRVFSYYSSVSMIVAFFWLAKILVIVNYFTCHFFTVHKKRKLHKFSPVPSSALDYSFRLKIVRVIECACFHFSHFQLVVSATAANRSTPPKIGQSVGTRTPPPPSQPPSTSALPPALWQDSHGLPVDTHDFVDFLCFYGESSG